MYIRCAVLALFIYRLRYLKIEANKRRPLETHFAISDNILSDVDLAVRKIKHCLRGYSYSFLGQIYTAIDVNADLSQRSFITQPPSLFIGLS